MSLCYSTLPAVQTMTGICAVRIVWLYTVFRHYGTLRSLFAAFPVTWVLTSAAVLISFAVIWRKKLRAAQPK